jgi:hypothetical protein
MFVVTHFLIGGRLVHLDFSELLRIVARLCEAYRFGRTRPLYRSSIRGPRDSARDSVTDRDGRIDTVELDCVTMSAVQKT